MPTIRRYAVMLIISLIAFKVTFEICHLFYSIPSLELIPSAADIVSVIIGTLTALTVGMVVGSIINERREVRERQTAADQTFEQIVAPLREELPPTSSTQN